MFSSRRDDGAITSQLGWAIPFLLEDGSHSVLELTVTLEKSEANLSFVSVPSGLIFFACLPKGGFVGFPAF